MSTRSNPTRSVPHRIAGTNGSMPGSVKPPRPPPLLVLYEDLVDPEDLGPAPVYGQYPRGLIRKALPWLRCQRHQVLHVCSGSLPRGEGTRIDVRPEARPDILADARALPFADGTWRGGILIDPPYSAHYARELYGVDYPRPSHLLREAARVIAPGGRIGIVHYITPKPVPGTWDSEDDERTFFRGLDRLKAHGISPDSMLVYMLIGHARGETHADRDRRRAKLREYGVRPYPMPYVRTGELGDELRAFQSWCIQRKDEFVPWEQWWGRAKGNPRKLGDRVTLPLFGGES